MSATQEKVSHTPEGWRAVASDDLDGYSIVDSRGAVVAEYVPSKALADLIVAVPELLAALKRVLAVADRKTDEFDAARAAVAKAERGQP